VAIYAQDLNRQASVLYAELRRIVSRSSRLFSNQFVGECYGKIKTSDACMSPRGGIMQCEWFVWNYPTNIGRFDNVCFCERIMK
jgi:hypothetical protein